MKKKIYISSIITLMLIFINIFSCYATEIGGMGVISGLNAAFQLLDSNEEKDYKLSNWLNKNSEAAGFIYDGLSLTGSNGILTPSIVYSCLPQEVKNQINDSSSAEEVYGAAITFIQNNQSVSENNVVNDESINTFIKNWEQNYVNSTGMTYGHDLRLTDSISSIQNGDFYNAVRDYINQYPNDLICVMWNNNYTVNTYISRYGIDGNFCFVKGSPDWWAGANWLTGTMYNNVDWTPSASANLKECLKWDNTNKEWSNDLQGWDITGWKYYFCAENDYYAMPTNPGATNWCVSTTHEKTYKVYSDINTMKTYSEGTSPYYYNNDVWQDFSSSSGDYVWSPTNINTVNYGDVNTHIQDSYNDNGSYPTTDTTNNWINNTNNENISGGSGEGGNGSGDDSGDSLLGQLGKVIGNLLKGIIDFITGILTGIVEGLTSLLESLTTLISDFVEAIPNILSPLIGWVFDGLPSEIQALILLGIGLGITISIIKILRG